MTALAQPMSPTTLLESTIAKKVVMALTGVVLFGFSLVHVAGHFIAFKGADAYNAYAHTLKASAAVLWGARSFLLVSVALHIWAALTLTASNNAARPLGYRATANEASTYASRTMKWGGPLLFFFIVYHLLHFTIGSAHGSFIADDAYHNLVTGFANPVVVAFYLLSMIALGLHLSHGFASMLQTLGLSHPSYNPLRKVASVAFGAIVCLAYCVFPIAVFAGLLK